MVLPGMARPMTACPRSPSPSPAPGGMVRASLASEIKMIDRRWGFAMKAPSVKPARCAIYTRVSTEHGLDQEFNSLDAQYDAASAYIKSQAHARLDPDPFPLRRWRLLRRIHRPARPAKPAGR